MIARRTGQTEPEVARSVVRLAAQAAAREGSRARAAHVGFHLIGDGLAALEREVGDRGTVRRFLRRCAHPAALPLYVGMICALTAGTAGPLLWLGSGWAWSDWRTILMVVAAVAAASQFATSVANLVATALLRPQALPRMDFQEGIPPDRRTIVVIPTLLGDMDAADTLLERLEIHYLGNQDPNLFFGLLTDFPDAPQKDMPGDAALLVRAGDGIRALNEKHAAEGGSIFHLFHRSRVWNPHERLWMGWERKRGKLEEFNALLRGENRSAFTTVVGELSELSSIKYVITLDTDTQLPRDTARKLVGLLAHPLNRPRYDPVARRVVEGYTILQPRVSIGLAHAARSRFAGLCAGETGIDPYTREVSDVYQDWFGEGSFVGKGIYDVDAFRAALENRFPENLILSHDLLESGYVRSALVSDVELIEDHPSTYPADASRRHRWIRGDWQIAGWLLPWVPGPDRRRQRNPLTALSRWKILDNLRRSLVAPALLLLLLGAWLADSSAAGFWTGAVVALTLLPPLLAAVPSALRRPREAAWRLHLALVLHSTLQSLAKASWHLLFLPYDAMVCLDAIASSGLRMGFTRRGLLLWHTPQYARRNARRSAGGHMVEMWIGPAVAMGSGIALALGNPAELPLSAPFLVAWALSPLVAWWLGQPTGPAQPSLDPEQENLLRITARKTWRYFEEFVNEGENWLPPDNFQEEPGPILATRTSPTNIGMSLLANLAAYDFGYLTAGRLIERTEKTFATLQRLERYRGHFYNWYDTRTLKPLPPSYISSVDSGNLLGALHTLRVGLLELKQQTVLPPQTWTGLADTLCVMRRLAEHNPAVRTRADRLLHQLAEIEVETLDAAQRALATLHAAAKNLLSSIPEGTDPALDTWGLAFERQCRDAAAELESFLPCAFAHLPTLQELAQGAPSGGRASGEIQRIERLAVLCEELGNMDFAFLYSRERKLFSVGFNVGERRLDPSWYDLLASEARLASFLLIAEGQLPQEHWFAMGRLLTQPGGSLALLSWSGSMFEYLMPLLLMPTYDGTLLDKTYRAVVAHQIRYGHQHGVPWGISESCYHTTDVHHNYQYRGFGVPGLGFKRGLADDMVVAPYASLLAAMIAPAAACDNLRSLAALGAEGPYGFYESVDFTPSRLPGDAKHAVVRAFMAHHQGMGLLAMAYVLLGRPMQRRFLANPLAAATELLLQERPPKTAPLVEMQGSGTAPAVRLSVGAEPMMRVFTTSHTPLPEVHLLSNSRYHVMATNAGGGYSRWRDLSITRWREDPSADCSGFACYLRDRDSGAFWSTAYHPTLRQGEHYEAIFLQARAEYRHRHEQVDAHTEICVSPEDDVEIRRIKLTNISARTRHLDVTSYGEILLAPLAADLAHRAFSNLFVQTELIPERRTILCTRRPRVPKEGQPWMFHLLVPLDGGDGPASFETDRARFIGRGRTLVDPAAMDGAEALGNSAGAVLDPIVAIRQPLRLAADASAVVHVISGMAESREAALALADKYREPHFADRAFEMAWSHSQVFLHHLGATEADAQLYGRLATSLLHANPLHRAAPSILLSNRRSQQSLWASGVSGDLPIVLVRIGDVNRLSLIREVLQAHAYWRTKGLFTDLVILNEDFSGYRQVLHERILSLIAAGSEAALLDKPGGIFPRRGDQLSEEIRVLFQSVARVVLTDTAETLAEQIERHPRPERRVPRFVPTRIQSPAKVVTTSWPREQILSNGPGGFTTDGREYVITLAPGQTTPAPWANVLANPQIGTVVSESGGSYTWAENAHEFRLTPWHNDPVTDASGEAFYLRDEETGRFWSPAPLPVRSKSAYITRHGFGYSVFEHTHDGIRSEMTVYVATDAPVKLVVVKLRNVSDRPRQVSVTGYWELVLGDWRHRNAPHIVTEVDPHTGALIARNIYHREFADRVVFAAVNEPTRTLTGNRAEFLGRNGTMSNPAAMGRAGLSGRVGAGLDPCAALQASAELPEGHEHEFVFVFGAGRGLEEAQQLVQRFGGTGGAGSALEAVWNQWNRLLGTVRVETPDPSLNVLANGWLVYQTLACRYWGRSGYYQSGGAFGFRDQLQDTMALLLPAPWLAREHLLRCAAHQFREGDVQHWWHPPGNRGVRTHCSDDYLWLPYAACRYVTMTGDTGVLDETAHFLDGRAVNADEEAYYDLPQQSPESASLYEHGLRAVKRGLRFGPHGLPLMGSGDWNDGMNLVGHRGQGESIWLAFFLHDVLRQWGALAETRQDAATVLLCREEAVKLRENIEKHAWDGGWYLRAFFDNGEPLGSHLNDECQIDSIAQSWAVLSGVADPERARLAMQAVRDRLVNPDLQLIRLFDPPFDRSAMEPGYIKGYLPGVRENGGQYTHGAIWAIMAFAALGDRDRAWELWRLANPVAHADRPDRLERYRVEPYVMAADIYSSPLHAGRGGWTWYTGSSGWAYRLLIETLLGLNPSADKLRLDPRLPSDWTDCKIHYRHRETLYHIAITKTAPEAVRLTTMTVDGVAQLDLAIPLVDDHAEHAVTVELGM